MRPKCVVALATMMAVALAGAGAPAPVAAAPQWRLTNGNLLAAGNNREAVLNQSSPSASLEFKIGANEYVLSCNRTPVNKGPTELIGGDPGKDELTALNLVGGPLCNVFVNLVVEPTCAIQKVGLLGPSTSTLEKVGNNVYDDFKEFVLAWEVVTLGGCPAALNKTFDMEKEVKGTVMGRRALSFSQVPVMVEGATNAKFNGEFRFDLGGLMRIDPGRKWEADSKVLGSGETAEAEYESKTIEFKSEGVELKCKDAAGEGLVTGGTPGTDLTTIDFTECSDVAESVCKVAEPISMDGVKSTLVTLNEAKEEYGDKLEAISSSVELTGSSCKAAGKYALEGNTVGRAHNSEEELEFTEPAQEGSTLKLGGHAATMVGDIKQHAGEVVEVAEETAKAEKEREEAEKEGDPLILPTPTSKAPLEFTATSGKAILETAEAKIECKEDTASGEFIGVREGTTTIDFHGCKDTSLGVSCHSLGDATETILTGGSVELVDLEKSSKLVLGLEFAPKELHVECSIALVLIKGATIGEISGIENGKATKTGTAIFKQEKGKQAIKECHLTKKFCESKKFLLEASLSGGAFKEAGLETEEKFTFGKEATFDF